MCATALAAGPVDDTLATGRKALKNEGLATAWRLAQKALMDAPDSAAAHEFAGEVLFRRGEFAQADAEFKSALGLDRQLARAWWGLGRVAECAAMNRTAVEDYQRAYQLDPKDPAILATWLPRLRGKERETALQNYAATVGASGDPKELQQRMDLAKALDGREVMTLASPYGASEIPLRGFVSGATHMRSYGVEVMVNGVAVKLVLDTGAAGIVMSRQAAERAGLTRVSDATVGGIGDNAKADGRLSRDRREVSGGRCGVSQCPDERGRAESGRDRRWIDRIECVFGVSNHAGFRRREVAVGAAAGLQGGGIAGSRGESRDAGRSAGVPVRTYLVGAGASEFA